ncbi:Lrp/AsnC ligand binding domain-containing protein [Piscicoccus intestinalis]|uniref:Lrp/AsnC ligand binding domain-containing protein n=1 Tax=Piscicoccus intestinalis TaxID=746033 RepID=UPI000838C3E7|nr:Lrp/AsnC ligand binding domain-containing protein [Piscicoccus intestinalis]
MVQAYVLIQTEVGRSHQVAAAIAALAGVISTSEVTGPYDIIVRVGADSLEALAEVVLERIQAIEGITRTLTCTITNP